MVELRSTRVVVAAVLAATAVLGTPVAGVAGSPPALALTPSISGAFNFGSVDVGKTSSQVFTLKNSGGSSTGALTVALSGSTAFTKTADNCTATSLGPEKSCSFTLAYSPTKAGAMDTATLSATGKKADTDVSLELTGTAKRHIYWAANLSGAIGRADIDGQTVDETFIAASYPAGIAVDNAYVYWTAGAGVGTTGTIGRAAVDGSSVDSSFVITTGESFPEGIAVDAGHIYWANTSNGTIGRATIDGSTVDQSFITGAIGPTGVAVDSHNIYWANGFASIGRADLDGTDVDQNFITGIDPLDIAVDSAHIYWTNFLPDGIGRADLDGSNVNSQLISSSGGPRGVAVDSGHIYWSNFNVDAVGRADLDGQNADDHFVDTGLASRPFDVAVEGG